MCTAVAFNDQGTFFGRNLDVCSSFGEETVITQRNFPLNFCFEKTLSSHFSFLGTAKIINGIPFYYDGFNEHGLCAAALEFPEYAVYHEKKEGMKNLCPSEVISFVLASCKNLSEAMELLLLSNITDTAFSKAVPNTPLHWIFADSTGVAVLESVFEGTVIHSNPEGILSNSPDFDYHIKNLKNYKSVSPDDENGTRAFGLPGDFSSASRFVRAAFFKNNSLSEEDPVGRMFHILSAVSVTSGTVRKSGGNVRTVYSCCMDTEKGIYYYKTYENSRICGLSLTEENSEGNGVIAFPMVKKTDILFQN